MVASLGASECFTAQFLDEKENWAKIEQAQIFCSEVNRILSSNKFLKMFYFL
jgi:hypothetical protein